ncbi:MAG: hypothetical protein WAN33_04325 [Candidatus Acidiferrales bacterium]
MRLRRANGPAGAPEVGTSRFLFARPSAQTAFRGEPSHNLFLFGVAAQSVNTAGGLSDGQIPQDGEWRTRADSNRE